MNQNCNEQPLATDGSGQSSVLAGCQGRRAANHESHVARKIEQSLAYMLQHINQSLQVATLAAEVSVSPSHYSALFKGWMGCSPIDYFIRLRMQQACRLFDSTSLNVKEVAAALGYDDPFYFSRSFKAIYQVAPSEYRLMPKSRKDMVQNAASVSVAPGPRSNGGIQAENRATAGLHLKAAVI